jgi:hypothetical protein
MVGKSDGVPCGRSTARSQLEIFCEQPCIHIKPLPRAAAAYDADLVFSALPTAHDILAANPAMI